jgi:hypothetical protein
MPFTDDDKTAIQEMIKDAIASSVSPISQQLEGIQTEYTRQIDGLAAKFKKQQNTVISDLTQQITNITEKLTGSQKEIPENKPEEKPTNNQPNEEFIQLQKKLELLQKNLEMEQQARRKAEVDQVLTSQKTQLVTKLGQKALNPDHFFTLALTEGHIKQGQSIEGNDYYYLEKKDALGDPQPVPLTSEEGVAIAFQILEQKYPYLVLPRPGNGGGTSTGGTPQIQSKYFNESPDQAAITAAIAAGKSADVYAELEKMI